MLHSPLDIVEYHHHNDMDLFPDYNRQVPFGCGTSIMYNYLDYRFKNNTNCTFQIVTYVTETYLCGELRASALQDRSYHIHEADAHFIKINDDYFRKNKIIRRIIDKRTGNEVKKETLIQSNAKVFYDEKFINKDLLYTE